MSGIAHSINSSDRFGGMLVIAVIIHLLIILGIAFDAAKPRQQNSEKSLDVIVVRNPAPLKNEDKPDFLAQQSQQGGGELEEKKRITAKPSKPTLTPAPQKKVESRPTPVSKPLPEKKVLVQKKSVQKQTVSNKAIQPVKTPKKVSVQQLLASTQTEIDLLTAELDRTSQNQSRKPKRKFINSSTQEYKYAAYLSAWKRKVENIGNLNYPEEAKKSKIYGNILMTVVLLPDGSVKSVKISTSSGHKLLDDAAVRIVNLAAPFSPFPANIRSETDELVITRTWQFVGGNKLMSN
jgi:protein TonB